MFDDVTLSRAKAELHHLSRQLAELHLEEQRCQLRRTRLEAEKARAQSFVDMGELAARLRAQPSPVPTVGFVPVFDDQPNGPRFVVPDKLTPAVSPPDRRKLKPDGTPPIKAMITAALKDAGRASRPTEVANYVRSKWWPDLRATSITSVMWRMAQEGSLTHAEGRYGLNAPNGAGHR